MMFLKSLHGDAICDSCQLGWWKRQGSQRTGSAVLPVAPDRRAWSSVSAHGPWPPSWITVLGASILHTAIGAEVLAELFCTRESCLKVRVRGLCRGTLWASETWLSTKGEIKGNTILLPRFYFYSQGIVDGLCWWLFHHSPASRNIKDAILPLMTVSFVTYGDNLDEEKETNFSSLLKGPKTEAIDIINFVWFIVFLPIRLTCLWLRLDGPLK